MVWVIHAHSHRVLSLGFGGNSPRGTTASLKPSGQLGLKVPTSSLTKHLGGLTRRHEVGRGNAGWTTAEG